MSKLLDIIRRAEVTQGADGSAYGAHAAGAADRIYLLGLVKNCVTALQLIADQTLCPELFPHVDPNSDELCIKTAITIALSAIEKVNA